MVLYSGQITPRLQYIADLISRELFNQPAELTTDLSFFNQYPGVRINYSGRRIDASSFYIQCTELLFESGVRDTEPAVFEQNGYKAFFANEGDMGFDVLAASFYLVSRYEEYLPHTKDSYQRYDHHNSLAFKEDFLHLPLVNIWLQDLRKRLEIKYPSGYFHRPVFKFMATYDIDMVYSYLHKGWYRNLGGLMRFALKGRWGRVVERINVLRGRVKDPYDAYEWLDALHLYAQPKACYFFLVADKKGRYDKNIHPSVPAFQRLISYHAAGYMIGLHPSWQSGDEEGLLREEKELLEYIADKDIARSRQHYIRFTLPDTYRKLLKAGIREDFSMGYGTINGFRASIASPYNWYDLEKETPTGLVIYPFCFMDANAFYQQCLSPQQAFTEMMHYYQIVRNVRGLMITIWHNNFLGTDKDFKGWREVYEIFLKEVIYWDRGE